MPFVREGSNRRVQGHDIRRGRGAAPGSGAAAHRHGESGAMTRRGDPGPHAGPHPRTTKPLKEPLEDRAGRPKNNTPARGYSSRSLCGRIVFLSNRGSKKGTPRRAYLAAGCFRIPFARFPGSLQSHPVKREAEVIFDWANSCFVMNNTGCLCGQVVAGGRLVLMQVYWLK